MCDNDSFTPFIQQIFIYSFLLLLLFLVPVLLTATIIVYLRLLSPTVRFLSFKCTTEALGSFLFVKYICVYIYRSIDRYIHTYTYVHTHTYAQRERNLCHNQVIQMDYV